MRRWPAGVCAMLPMLAEAGTAALAGWVPHIDAPPQIDGRLDDAPWARAAAFGEFSQVAPQAGTEPSRKTTIRMVHDGRMLYVAIRAFEPEPTRIVARTLRRDADAIDGDDHVTLVLDPQGSRRNGFAFRVNALGAQFDGLVFDGAQLRKEWDAAWDAAATTDAEGWAAELAFPLAILAVPADGRGWRFNAERYVAASGERMRLFGVAAGRDVTDLSDAGVLDGITPDGGDWGLRLRPGLRWASERFADGRRRAGLEPSLDAFYRVAPGITATLTFNTDFAEADLDERVVSLSRFELFRPEKRVFFTQDSGRFAFGGLDVAEPKLLPFFSRRVGLGRSLDAGVKLAGSAGPIEFGALALQVGRGAAGVDAADAPTPRVGVLRVAGAVSAEQRLGLIATEGNPQGTAGSRLAGIDYQYRSTSAFGEHTLEGHAWVQRSTNQGLGAGQASGGSLRYPNIGFIGELSWQQIGASFLPALGFVEETGVRRADGNLGWWHRTAEGANAIARLYAGQRRRLDGSERSHYIGPGVEISNAQGDSIAPEVFVEQERIARPYELLPGVIVPAGDYRWAYVALEAGLSASREVSGGASLRSGGYYGGRLDKQALNLAWRPSAHWGLSGSLARDRVRLPSGAFVAKTASLRLDHAGSPRSEQSLVVQHDNVSRQTSVGLRARWTLAPGRELLAALDRVRPGQADPQALQTAATIKLVWNWER